MGAQTCRQGCGCWSRVLHVYHISLAAACLSQLKQLQLCHEKLSSVFACACLLSGNRHSSLFAWHVCCRSMSSATSAARSAHKCDAPLLLEHADACVVQKVRLQMHQSNVPVALEGCSVMLKLFNQCPSAKLFKQTGYNSKSSDHVDLISRTQVTAPKALTMLTLMWLGLGRRVLRAAARECTV